MKRYLTLYILFVKYSLIQAMMYKENFIIWSLVTVGWFVLNLVFYQFIYTTVDEIAGWTKPQLLILLGIYFIFDFVLWGLLWRNMRDIPQQINRGTLDLQLTKPVNLQFLLSFKSIGLDNALSLVLGLMTIIYGTTIGNIRPSPLDVALATASVLVAFVYVYAAWFITMCTAFWLERAENLHFLFPGLRHFWKIPQPFYKGILRGVLTFVIPATLVTTVPAQFLLHKPSLPLFILLIVFAAGTLICSHLFLKLALRRYVGAGS